MWVLGKELRVWTKAEKSTRIPLLFSHCPPLLPHLQEASVSLSPSHQAHLHTYFLLDVISLSLKHSPRKEKMLQERGTFVKYPLERFHHANYYWSFSLSAPPLTFDSAPEHLSLRVTIPIKTLWNRLVQGRGVEGLLVPLDGGFDIFKAKDKPRVGTDLLTCTWLLGPYHHPETSIQLPKDNKDTDSPLWLEPSISNIWIDDHIHHAFQHSRIWNAQLLLAIKRKPCLFLSIYTWLSLQCLRF